MFDVVIAGGRVVDGTGLPWFRADVGVAGGRIAAVGDLSRAAAAARIDAAGRGRPPRVIDAPGPRAPAAATPHRAGRVVAPGFIDAHVHGDLALFADPHHEPAIRQGVTTYILGQDGSAMAPASPATLAYMRRYTAGFNGGFETPGLSWRSLDEYLNCLDRRCALNVACLVPNGNVRLEVIGLDPRPATPDELGRMRRLVREAMEQGAVGLSSGLDYIPSRYAHEAELTALCEEIAPFGGVYVTHMRGYTPEKVLPAMEEVANIGRGAGCAVHISHFNSLASQVLPVLDAYRAEGIDMTFDLYCYLAGSTILGMIALPPEVQEGGLEPTLERLRSPEVRQRLPEWFARMRSPVESVRLGWVPAEEYRRFEGKTLGEAAGEAGVSIADFVCDVLIATRMATNCVVPHDLRRTEEDVRGLLRHPAMMAGSDGIYVGGHPHPRGCGCFAHYVGHYARQRGDWSLEQAVSHLSYHAARRFRLHDRGLIAPGMAADVIVFDFEQFADRATYERGRELAVGMEHVLVNGEPVLLGGKRTASLPGRALRRGG